MNIENEINPSEAKNRLRDLQEQLAPKVRQATQVTDDFVHENAWTTVAIAAVIGCMIGFFLRPRD